MALGFKTGGRQKGTPNRSGNESRKMVRVIFEEQFTNGRVSEALDSINGERFLHYVFKMMPLLIPKATNLTLGEEEVAEPEINEPQPAEQEAEETPTRKMPPYPLRLPLMTAEEAARFRIENLTDRQYDLLIEYNEKNRDRWAKEEEEEARRKANEEK